jgi:hypothetical protein
VNCIVPDHVPATFSGDGAEGDELDPHAETDAAKATAARTRFM